MGAIHVCIERDTHWNAITINVRCFDEKTHPGMMRVPETFSGIR